MGKYKGMTPARARASEKYLAEKVDTIIVRVPKGKKAEIQAAAKAEGVSVSNFCARAIEKELNGDIWFTYH